VQAEVEGGHHLVLALDPRVDAGQGAQPVQPQHGQARCGQRAEVAAGALDPQQLDRLAGHRVDGGALGRGVPAGVVGVPRVCTQAVAATDQVADRAGIGHGVVPSLKRVSVTLSEIIINLQTAQRLTAFPARYIEAQVTANR
jgi:hypothetical protein